MLIVLFTNCSKEELFLGSKIQNNESKINLQDTLIVSKNKDENINVILSTWMFKEKSLALNSIADWIGVKNEGKIILEPINVIWVDFVSKNKHEAENKVIHYLTENNFLHRSGSSVGYASFFENKYWIDQYRETWSDKIDPNTINNHGRIFLGFKTFTNFGNTAYVSTGAFSIEDEKHYFLSFDEALNQFNDTELWSLYSENINLNTITNNYVYATFDHKRVKTFILK